MNTKNFLQILLLCLTANATADTPQPDCTGKAAEEKTPVLVAAEQRAADLKNALATCLAAQNCQNCPVFRQAIQGVGDSLIELDNHLRTLHQNSDGSCKNCKKKEVQALQDHLATLHQEAQKTLSSPEVQNALSTVIDRITHK